MIFSIKWHVCLIEICSNNVPSPAGENSCQDLVFTFQDTAVGTNLALRSWNIRVTQYDCGYENLAPAGCTQYFWGEDDGYVQSYNFQSGSGYHLANQNQKICFRREKGNSKICYASSQFTDFQVSKGKAAGATKGSFLVTNCCGYKAADGKGADFDCLRIPSASSSKGAILKATGN